MRLGLRTKFLLSFLVISVAVLASMIAVTHVIAFKDFQEIGDQIGKMKIDSLVISLHEEYRTHNGWTNLRNNPQHLRTLVDNLAPHFSLDPPTLPLLLPPKVPAILHSFIDKMTFGNGSGHGSNGHEQPHGNTPLPPVDLPSLITLFDDQDTPVVGSSLTPSGLALRKIYVDGKTVGWLAIKNPEPSHIALFLRIVTDQSISLLIVGTFILVLAILAAFFLSRHLLSPVKQLAKGAQAFANRDFEKRIRVTSTDELGKLAQDFNSMAGTLQKYEEIRKQWLSDISHELRTPLSILRGEIEALLDGIRETNRDTLSSLHAETIHISRIVDDLHELSLADSGALHIKLKPVFPVKVLNEQFSLFQKKFADEGITVIENINNDGPCLLGDKDRLAQLFANLFKNTLLHTDSPGRLKVWHVQDSSQISLYFEDSKPGVPEESLDKVFDRLYRVDSSRNRSKGGSGLGLAICKNIVESHGGNIVAATSSLGGLKIEIVLPIDYP